MPEDTTATSEAPETRTTTADEGATRSEGVIATADGTDLLSVVEGDAGGAERLAPYAGEDVTATGVDVLEENPAEGSDDAIVLPDDQGTEQLDQQGRHIELSELTPA